MQVLLNAQEMPVLTARDLHQCLEQIRQQQFNELWLTTEEDGPSFCTLVNGASAWLMYLQTQGDADFASVREVAGALTPAPGVGPLANVLLLKQCVEAAWQEVDDADPIISR